VGARGGRARLEQAVISSKRTKCTVLLVNFILLRVGAGTNQIYFYPGPCQPKTLDYCAMVLRGPPLPPAISWYPGHMASFSKSLPTLLQSTHVVLEARDARLPLTSINPAFESLLGKWFQERGGGVMGPLERIVVYNKADLVPQWGIQVGGPRNYSGFLYL
jgi:hypothetical protein